MDANENEQAIIMSCTMKIFTNGRMTENSNLEKKENKKGRNIFSYA